MKGKLWYLLENIYIFTVMNQAIRKTYDQQGAWWSPKRPLGKQNGDSKLVYALLSILTISHKDPGRSHTSLK